MALLVYKLTRKFPEDERFGLAAQMRRAAVSIAANIAEGFGRFRAHDKARFYTMSQGSTEELKYYAILCQDLGYLADRDVLFKPLEEVSRLLRRLVNTTLDS